MLGELEPNFLIVISKSSDKSRGRTSFRLCTIFGTKINVTI